ncbi:type II toxin-antitoxin system PrlF family antitoxin [Microaerobacter geothermalis]|uniref:AbrB/MazE/SpoVT family DNA-binding domain-containing protein n=1 Tax=Microaerobacter geothermalis TaxID=674972 RepID=UPI001F3FABD8|nr:type II toxin-antitoxin system PrlF family antitoxin [Microaerobacter geothermalis]MCF6093254.1 type II toxin-antitoxin system PrlF family antitoxin [Microaerobacter geothermalis]
MKNTEHLQPMSVPDISAVSTISKKGQITIPVKIREYIHADIGDQIQFVLNEAGEVVVKVIKPDSLLSLFGSMPPRGERENKTWEEIRQQARDEMVEE